MATHSARGVEETKSTATATTPAEAKPAEGHPTTGPVGMCPYHNALKKQDVQCLRDVAARTIRERVFGDQSLATAEKVLVEALQIDPADKQGKTNHMLGLLYFHMEKYGDALKHLEVAVKANPKDADIKALRDRVATNIGTKVEQAMGPTEALDGDALKLPPALHLREPQGIKPLGRPAELPWAQRAARSDAARAVAGTAVELLKDGVALRTRQDALYDFENWDTDRGSFEGKIHLGRRRDDLNANRLHSTYPAGQPVGHQAPGQVKPEWTDRVRTATGAWTTSDPMEGAAGTEFQRTGAPAAARKSRVGDPSLPSEREVSRAMLAATGPRLEADFLNTLAIQWIQFQNHDWVNHRGSTQDGYYEIPLAADDPFRKKYGIDKLSVPKSARNPLPQNGKLTFLNEVTHWWDGSQIYGSDQATQDRLRQGPDGKQLAGGKMRIDGDLLPINPATGIEDSGMTRNWWVGLNMFHTLFVKHHNYICDELKKKHPDWSSDQLFHTARLVNAAIMAKIHTVEWTPAVLPNEKLVSGMATNWWGLFESRKPFEERRINPPHEVKDPILGGIVGGDTNNHGKPYGLSEEFVEVYRLHAAMPDFLKVMPVGAKDPVAQVTADGSRGAMSRQLIEKHGMETWWNSLGHQKMNALVNNNYPALFTDMSVDGNAVVDLGAIDILRARERGVPPYNQFRRDLGLKPIEKFEDLGVTRETVEKLEKLYGKGKEGVEKMDLLVGTLTEARRPENYGFGETLFTVFIQMATRRLQADPWYTTKMSPENFGRYYSEVGKEMIETQTLKDILLIHYPNLKSSLVNVNNAFEPWGTTAESHPHEHPLTARTEVYAKRTSDRPIRVRRVNDGTRYIVDLARNKVWLDLNRDGKIDGKKEELIERSFAGPSESAAVLESVRAYAARSKTAVPGAKTPNGLFEIRGSVNKPDHVKLQKGEAIDAERSALKLHLDFFDTDLDGQISWDEQKAGWSKLGFGSVLAFKQAVGTVAVFGDGGVVDKVSEGSLDIEKINDKRYSGSTGIYDAAGRINQAKLNEYLAEWDRVGRPLTFDEVESLLKGKSNGLVSRAQFKALFAVAEKVNGRAVITKEQFRGNFDGSFMYAAAAKVAK